MKIGEASRMSGVSAKMIRYYEEIDLLRAPARQKSGYRNHTETDVHRIRFVRRARDFGFSVEQIRELLRLWSDRARSNAEVKNIALAHVEMLDAKIKDLIGLRNVLHHLAEQCDGDGRPDCPILEELTAS